MHLGHPVASQLQISFYTRAIDYVSLLRKMTCKDTCVASLRTPRMTEVHMNGEVISHMKKSFHTYECITCAMPHESLYHTPQNISTNNGSFAEGDLQLKASYHLRHISRGSGPREVRRDAWKNTSYYEYD